MYALKKVLISLIYLVHKGGFFFLERHIYLLCTRLFVKFMKYIASNKYVSISKYKKK